MFLQKLLSLLLVALVFAPPNIEADRLGDIGTNPIEDGPLSSVIGNNDDNYGKALDPYDPDFEYTANITKSLKAAGWQTVFIRGFKSNGKNGKFDANSVGSAKHAQNAGLGIEIFMEPQPFGNLTGGEQLHEVYQNLSDKGIVLRSIWLQVSRLASWSADSVFNVAYINSTTNGANQLGLIFGIYTNATSWYRITNNFVVASNVSLWYYQQLPTEKYTGTANFDDFKPIAGFYSPLVKQWSSYDKEGVYTKNTTPFNRNIYKVGFTAAKKPYIAPKGKIVAGGIGL